MSKKIISIVLLALTLAMLVPFGEICVVAEDLTENILWYNSHEGETDLYIKTKQDFLGYAVLVKDGKTFEGKVIHIQSDLDFSDDNIGDWQTWIGRANEVSAIIDGHGHTISGLTYTSSNEGVNQKTYSGLLGGKLCAGGSVNTEYGASVGVFNLAIRDCCMTVNDNYTGALFGDVEGTSASFKNVYVDVDIESDESYVGGLVGYINNSSVEITNCAVDGALTAKKAVGGFVGHNGVSDVAQLTISNCGFYGSVSGESNVAAFAGANGKSSNNTVLNFKNVLCVGTVTGSGNVLVGANASKNAVGVSNAVASSIVTGADVSDCTVVSDALLKGNNANGMPPEFVALQEGYAVPYGVVNFLRYKWISDSKTRKATEYIGYQEATDNPEGELEIRLSALLNDGKSGASIEGFSAVGYDISLSRRLSNGTLKTWNNTDGGSSPEIKKVYTSAIYGGVSKSAESLGGDYIFVACIGGIRKQVGELIITVRTFYCDEAGTRVYGDTAVIVLDTGNAE